MASYDVITSWYLATQANVSINEEVFAQLETQSPSLEARCRKYDIDLTSGYALFSALLPEDFNYHHYKTRVTIVQGILLRSPIHTEDIKIIFNKLNIDYGLDRANQFLADTKIIMDWFRDYCEIPIKEPISD